MLSLIFLSVIPLFPLRRVYVRAPEETGIGFDIEFPLLDQNAQRGGQIPEDGTSKP